MSPSSTSPSPVPAVTEAWLELPDGRTVWLKLRCSIGRQFDNDVVLNAHTVSRHHALLVATTSGYSLSDLHSSNGSYVNRTPVTRPTRLNDGDELRFGEYVVRYRCTRVAMPDGNSTLNDSTRRIDDVSERTCWLLLADIVGYSTLNAQVGSKVALARLQAWITGMRPLVERYGGHINSYVGDAIFAWWETDPANAAQLGSALGAMETWRAQSPVTFRLVVHHGLVFFTHSERGEELSGHDVNFLFRVEKVAKRFGANLMLSEAAVRSLGVLDSCRRVGKAAVEGIDGQHEFFALVNEPPDPA